MTWFKKTRIKNYSQGRFDDDLINKFILGDNRLNKFKSSKLNRDKHIQLFRSEKKCTKTY